MCAKKKSFYLLLELKFFNELHENVLKALDNVLLPSQVVKILCILAKSYSHSYVLAAGFISTSLALPVFVEKCWCYL